MVLVHMYVGLPDARDVCISTILFCPTMWGHPKPTRMFRFEYNHSIINHKQNWVCHQHWVHELWVRSSQPRFLCTWLPVWKQSESGNMTILFSRGRSSTNLVVWKWGVPPSLMVYHPEKTEEKVPFWVRIIFRATQIPGRDDQVGYKTLWFSNNIIYNEHYTPLDTTINTIINTIISL